MTSPRLLLAAVLLTVLAVAVGIGGAGGLSGEGPDGPWERSWSAAGARNDRPPLAEARALAVLHRWDERRSRAWAQADPAALARLYLPGSRTGSRDVAMLRHWRSRGLRVRHLRVQVLTARVLVMSRERLVVVVTDRLLGAKAVGRRGGAIALPRDRASRHLIRLRSLRGEWRVGEVRAQPSPVRRTARTPPSRKS